MVQEVIFRLNNEDFGLEIMNVNEIIRMQELTAMPNTSAYILGVTNIRGKVIPIISMKKILGMEESADDDRTRIIVASLGEKIYGFKVDSVSEIIKIEEDQIDRQEGIGEDKEKNYIFGIAKLEERLVKLIDLEKILQ
ncbi:MAG: chemotaxis protein CheW [Eubacteriales bacterium]|jgi:purine-binding chemotaxis protein CheW|nr:chemotaxis protein CheW [Eubacteriales bacterium]NCC81081.1 chemotaxis protein CheW [Clostridia bacterium]